MNILEALYKIGLTKYESRAYIKLVEYGILSAKELSELTGIPYSKIYATLISLVDKGWVSIKEGRPKKYRSIEPSFACEVAVERQTHDMADAIQMVNDTLQSIYNEDTATGKSEIWSIKGNDNVYKKVREIINMSHHEAFCLLFNLDESDLSQINNSIQNVKDRGCHVVAFYKKSPEKKINLPLNNFIIWESSHKITGKGIFLFIDSKIIFLGSLGEKPTALWSNDSSFAELVGNIVSIERLEKYVEGFYKSKRSR